MCFQALTNGFQVISIISIPDVIRHWILGILVIKTELKMVLYNG